MEIKVDIHRPEGVRHVDWSLDAGFSPVRPGIQEEYADSILEGARTHERLSHYGSGVLHFITGAASDVNSNIVMFRLATASLLYVLLQPVDSFSTEPLTDVITTELDRLRQRLR